MEGRGSRRRSGAGELLLLNCPLPTAHCPLPTMPEAGARQHGRIEPTLAWTILTDAPLRGLAMAREVGRIFAWDEGDQLYLLDSMGRRWSTSRAPEKILAGGI